jgi:hypothetical protein
MRLPMINSPGQKAKKTGIWAKTMAKWHITYLTKGSKKWRIVSFEGENRGESRGVVDFIAIRRKANGDYFELILFQVKGGRARMPTDDDKRRLKKIEAYYHAKCAILATWKKGVKLTFQFLDDHCEWKPQEGKKIFK